MFTSDILDRSFASFIAAVNAIGAPVTTNYTPTSNVQIKVTIPTGSTASVNTVLTIGSVPSNLATGEVEFYVAAGQAMAIEIANGTGIISAKRVA